MTRAQPGRGRQVDAPSTSAGPPALIRARTGGRVSRLAFVGAALLLAGCAANADRDRARAPLAESSAALRAQLHGATRSHVTDFPATRGRSLRAVADAATPGTEVALAGTVFTTGENRLAFGVVHPDSGFVYGKTAVYVADTPDAKARGPFPAPADLLITDPAYRSRTAASGDDVFAAVYETVVPFDRPGKRSILVVTLVGGKLVGATSQITVVATARDHIPRPGERPPAIVTDTVASASGDIASIDTRLPPDDMHDVAFADVIGRKPVALLFATPALCASRVCGPVVDIALQLKTTYGERVQFIHQEVFVDNDPSKGLRDPLRAFALASEPWLFVFDRHGRLATRLEGSFGFDAFERALRSGL